MFGFDDSLGPVRSQTWNHEIYVHTIINVCILEIDHSSPHLQIIPSLQVCRCLTGYSCSSVQDIDGQLKPALRQVQSLMPAFDIEAKLHEGSGVWWSTADAMRGSGRRIRYT